MITIICTNFGNSTIYIEPGRQSETKKVNYCKWCIDRHFLIKVPKLVQMIVTLYRVQAYQVPIVNPRWSPKIQDGRHEIQFFDIFA